MDTQWTEDQYVQIYHDGLSVLDGTAFYHHFAKDTDYFQEFLEENEQTEESAVLITDAVCTLKYCYCENGRGVLGKECMMHNVLHCSRCNNGFHLEYYEAFNEFEDLIGEFDSCQENIQLQQ